ncbi:ABC transporter ATP-binding protein [Leucobacter sp. USHLN153]|uniref:ABC transporter ATP-binding protein n=1 Tax=Leucobacter sp. USHLN153 TaxID=3081268 RepID=UPI003017ABB9
MSADLVISEASVKRGGLEICRDISLTAPAGEITVLLGANGMGKTTLLDGVAGVLPLASGRITLGGRRIDGLPPDRRASRGLAYVQQGRGVFAGLSVAQNLAVVDGSQRALDRAFELFPRLAERRDVRAGRLSGGEQQMLVIARALATRPTCLLVDELSLGLAPRVAASLMAVLQQLARDGIGVLLVEQFVETALSVGTTAHLMQRGRIVRSGAAAELLQDRDALISPYLDGGAGPGATERLS